MKEKDGMLCGGGRGGGEVAEDENETEASGCLSQHETFLFADPMLKVLERKKKV